MRSGRHGADLALLAVVDTGHIAARLIGSGDHIIALAVASLAAAGRRVTTGRRLAASLARAAGPRLIYLDAPGHAVSGQHAA